MIVLGAGGLMNRNIPKREANTPSFIYFFSELSLGGRGARFFDWFREIRFKALVQKISNLIVQKQIDCVMGVFPNKFYCLAACRAAAKQKIPFYAYFHNTLADNHAVKDPNAVQIQTEIFENARLVFVMSKGMQQFFQDKYATIADKFVPLIHTFQNYPDESMYTGIPGINKDTYELVAIGNFNHSNIEATQRLVRAVSREPKYRLTLHTNVPIYLLQQRGIDTTFIEKKGLVPINDWEKALQHYDICVLTHGFFGDYGKVEYQTIFPTRTLALLLSGKPMLVHSPKGSFLNQFIREHACAELIEEASEAAVIDGLEKIASDTDYQARLVAAAKKTAQQFYGPKVAEQLRTALRKTMVEPKNGKLDA